MKLMATVFLCVISVTVFRAQSGSQSPGYLRSLDQTYALELTLADSMGQATVWYTSDTERNETSLFSVRDISLEDADLHFKLDLEKYQGEFFYAMRLSYTPAEGPEQNPKQPRLARDYDRIPADTGSVTLIWEDALAYDLDFGRPYRIIIAGHLPVVVPIDCNSPRPDFGFNKQIPHWAGLAAGALLIGLGQVALDNSDEDYVRYKAGWQSYLNSNGDLAFKENAQPFFEEAKDNHRSYRALTYAGIAVIGLDAAWFAFRWLHHRETVNLYDRYCQDKGLTVSPATFGSVFAGITPAVGMKMTVRF